MAGSVPSRLPRKGTSALHVQSPSMFQRRHVARRAVDARSMNGASGGGNSRSARALPKLRAWVRALRPLAQGNLAPFILVGAFEGRRHGHAVDPVGVALALLWGVMDHGAIVLANDLGDEEADRHSRGATLLSGGSRVLVDGALGSSSLARGLMVAAAGLAIVSVMSAWLYPARAALVVFCTCTAAALLFAYGHGPRLSYRGGGEWLQALGVGVVLPTVGAAMQPAHAVPLAWSTYAALVILGLAGNIATSIPDAEDDAAASKWSPAARLGVSRAFRWSLGLNVAGMTLAAWTASPAALVALPVLAFAASRSGLVSDRSTRMRAVYPLAFGGGAVVLAWAVANIRAS